MGVKSLQTFLKNNEHYVADKILFSNSTLIIDGNNLLCQLYLSEALDRQSPNHRNDIYGGDLITYQNNVTKFFKTLLDCKVVPIVVFDGSVIGKAALREFVGSKEKEVYNRGLEKFKRAQTLTEVPQCDDLLLPQTINAIFRDVVTSLNITRVQTAYEADTHIARHANEHNCPVLTNDSDFMIYHLKRGFILLDWFDHKHPVQDSNGNLSIKCSLFSQQKLSKSLPALKPEVLPLLSVILGNDYVEPGTFDRVTDIICNVYYDGFLEARSFNHRKIANLLLWLRRKSLNEAIDFILDLVHPNHQARLKKSLELFMRNYRIEVTDDFDDELSAIYDPERKLPINEFHPTVYLKRLMQSSDLGFIALDIIFHNTHYDYTIVEDFSLPPSSQVKYRAYSLALVLLRPQAYTGLSIYRRKITSEQDSLYIYDRLNDVYTKMIVRPMETLDGFGALEHLDCQSMIIMEPESKATMLRACFRFTKEEFDLINECVCRVFRGEFAKELVICLLLIKYIGIECHQPPKPQFVDAILSTFFFYAACDGSLNESITKDASLYGLALLKIRPHTVMVNDYDYSPCDPHIFRRCVHFISQLQSVYRSYNALNALLNHPYHITNQGIFMNCVLIYRLTKLFRLERLKPGDMYKTLSVFQNLSETIKTLVGC